jgi:hypothetical protein
VLVSPGTPERETRKLNLVPHEDPSDA